MLRRKKLFQGEMWWWEGYGGLPLCSREGEQLGSAPRLRGQNGIWVLGH